METQQKSTANSSKAANPLSGRAPAPDQLRDKGPKGEHPNASFHVENDPDWKNRPSEYPAAKHTPDRSKP